MRRKTKTTPKALVKSITTSALILYLTGTAAVCTAAAKFEDSQIYVELNHTDGDLGIHGLVDGGTWRNLSVQDANGQVLPTVQTSGMLTERGMAELFFESAEPTFAESSPEEGFARFPDRWCRISATAQDRVVLWDRSLVRNPPAPC